jgi:hypothetical protein
MAGAASFQGNFSERHRCSNGGLPDIKELFNKNLINY